MPFEFLIAVERIDLLFIFRYGLADLQQILKPIFEHPLDRLVSAFFVFCLSLQIDLYDRPFAWFGC